MKEMNQILDLGDVRGILGENVCCRGHSCPVRRWDWYCKNRSHKMRLFGKSIGDWLFPPLDVGKLRRERNIEGLIGALGYDKDHAIQQEAIDALGSIGDSLAIEPLIKMFSNHRGSDKAKTKTRVEILKALRSIGGPQVVKALKLLMTNSYGAEKCQVAASLHQLGFKSPEIDNLLGFDLLPGAIKQKFENFCKELVKKPVEQTPKCPSCDGKGEVQGPPGPNTYVDDYRGTYRGCMEKCTKCGGSGKA